MKKVALLFSAGVESSSLAVHYLANRYLVLPVYVKCGFSWEKTEVKWAQKLWVWLRKKYTSILPFKIVPAKGLRPSDSGIEIPLRNLILISSVAIEAKRKGINKVACGSLGIYPFPDNNRNFFDRLEALFSENYREKIAIDTPFMGKKKAEIVNAFYSKAPYHLTFSCMRPIKNQHCGKCEKCIERKEGFRQAGIPDPTFYFFKRS